MNNDASEENLAATYVHIYIGLCFITSMVKLLYFFVVHLVLDVQEQRVNKTIDILTGFSSWLDLKRTMPQKIVCKLY